MLMKGIEDNRVKREKRKMIDIMAKKPSSSSSTSPLVVQTKLGNDLMRLQIFARKAERKCARRKDRMATTRLDDPERRRVDQRLKSMRRSALKKSSKNNRIKVSITTVTNTKISPAASIF